MEEVKGNGVFVWGEEDISRGIVGEWRMRKAMKSWIRCVSNFFL